VLPDGYWTMASMFRDAGYRTALFGKWHLGSDPAFYPGKYGFDYSYGSLAGGVDPYTHRYKRGPYTHTWHRNKELITEYGHATDLITNEAIDWIRDQSGSWFCYVPYTAVHTPIKAPEQWVNRYWDQTYDEDPARDCSFKMYAAYASHMDDAIGRLIETLKCIDQLDNTIVVIASDNGAQSTNPSQDTAQYPGRHEDMPRLGSNSPLRGNKAQMYEGGIRTPAVISWPGRLKPNKLEWPIHIADWMPTFAFILESNPDIDPKWDGRNIMPLITGESQTAPARKLYWNLRNDWFAIRSGDWKLSLYKSKQEVELFNIKDDPLEQRDVVTDYPEIAEQLARIIDEEHKSDDDSKRNDVE
jgi:arylsulfatase A-like enzyme